jgi:hypothetical protein
VVPGQRRRPCPAAVADVEPRRARLPMAACVRAAIARMANYDQMAEMVIYAVRSMTGR